MDEDAGPGDAGLAAGDERGERDAVDGQFEVRGGEDELRRSGLSATFERLDVADVDRVSTCLIVDQRLTMGALPPSSAVKDARFAPTVAPIARPPGVPPVRSLLQNSGQHSESQPSQDPSSHLHFLDQRRRHQRLARLDPTWQDRQHAVRQAPFLADLSELEDRQRGELARLEDDAVAGREGERELLHLRRVGVRARSKGQHEHETVSL